jgi:hypothetical protein
MKGRSGAGSWSVGNRRRPKCMVVLCVTGFLGGNLLSEWGSGARWLTAREERFPLE